MKSRKASFGLIILGLSLAQFIMTVDTTIMNVSVPTLVKDLETVVTSVQAAITLYALVMASLMLVGSKLGEIFGRKKMFQVGLIIYGIGSAITAAAPNITVLMFGWSILEGIGAALMMPAMMALISINFKGAQRVKALGIVAGVAGAAAALGPIIGGALSTYASWRYAFIGEVVIALITLGMSKNISDVPVQTNQKLDIRGSLLAVSGLALIVYGVLQIGTYGLIKAIKPYQIAGVELELFGLSIVPVLLAIGGMLLWVLFNYERRIYKERKPYLLKVSLLSNPPFRSGLSVVLLIQLILAGTLFVLPLFLQLVLGYSAMESGVALLPISIALIMASFFGQALAKGRKPIEMVRFGIAVICVGLVVLVSTVSNNAGAADLIVPFLLIGSGIGLVIPFIQNIVLGSVEDVDASQAAGLNYTYQQLGMSLGTAIIGSVLIFSLGNNVVQGLSSSNQFNQQAISDSSVKISTNVEFVSNNQLRTSLEGSDLSEEQIEDAITINSDARIRALKVSLAVTIMVALLAFSAAGRIKDSLEKA